MDTYEFRKNLNEFKVLRWSEDFSRILIANTIENRKKLIALGIKNEDFVYSYNDKYINIASYGLCLGNANWFSLENGFQRV